MKTAPYIPMTWSAGSHLSREEQDVIESQRRDLWNAGVRREPGLTEMAFMFAATICMMRASAREKETG